MNNTATSQSRSLLEPRALAAIRDLRLVARRAVEGLHAGQHRSQVRGSGLEFSQYRNYTPGDDPRRVDWKLYARSDRYFVREAHRESQLELWLVLDVTGSMRQASDQIDNWRRLDCARCLAASLAWLANEHGDAVGLLTIGGTNINLVPPRAGQAHLDRLCRELASVEASGAQPVAPQLEALWNRLKRPAMLVLISDFLDERQDICDMALRLAAGGMDTVALQLLTRAEEEFPFRGGLRLRDPETGRYCEVDADLVRNGYRRRFEAAQQRLQQTLLAADVEHHRMLIEQPLDRILWEFLRYRQDKAY